MKKQTFFSLSLRCAALVRWMVAAVLVSAVPAHAEGVQGAGSHQHGVPQKDGSRQPSARSCTAVRDAFDIAAIERLKASLRAGAFGNVDEFILYSDTCLIDKIEIKHDYFQAYQGSSSPVTEYDYRSPVIHPFYRGTPLHTVQSITKSVTSIIYAIALRRGDVKRLDTPVLDYFDRSKVQNPDPRKDRIRVRDLLNMTSGLDWHDEPDSSDLEQKTSDWAKFAIDKPMATEPRARFLYSNGDGALLAYVFAKATGIDIVSYAQRYLFRPLGVKGYHWKRAPNGLADTTGGLYLTAEDLAKIGMLVVDRGNWRGRQLYSPDYLDPARTISTGRAPDMGAYNNLFWVPASPCAGELILAGNGYGGQRLLIFPERRVVAVFFSWNIAQFYDALPARAAIAETAKIFRESCPRSADGSIIRTER